MRRLLLFSLALTGFADCRIPTVGPAHDINNAVNPWQFVIVRWNSGDQLVCLDLLKQRLIRCPYDSPDHLSLPPVTMMENLGSACQLLTAELDDHAGPEVVLIEGNRCHIWNSASGGGTDAPDKTIPLPVAVSVRRAAVAIEDFDGDGTPDLLLPSEQNFDDPPAEPPGNLLFSFATPTPEVVKLPLLASAGLTTAKPWRPGGPPVILFRQSGLAPPVTTVVEYQADRTPHTLEAVSGGGFFVELDGIAPPERVEIGLRGPFSNQETIATVQQKSGDEWNIVATLPTRAESSWLPPRAAIADFDGDGRQELILAFESLVLPPESVVQDFRMIRSLGTPEATTATSLPGMVGALIYLDPVRFPGGKSSGLATFLHTNPVWDALGNPASLPGSGTLATLRGQPLNSNSPNDRPLLFNELPVGVAAGKLDEDEVPDLVITGINGRVTGHFNPFGPPAAAGRTTIRIGPVNDPGSLTDLNGDGLHDLLLVQDRWLAPVLTVPSTGEGTTFGAGPASPLFTVNAIAPTRLLATADFDLDGDADALFLHGRDETLVWAENNGSGKFDAQHPISQAGRLYQETFTGIGTSGAYRWIGRPQTQVFDADGDGDPDVLTFPSALGDRLTLHRNQSGTFTLEPVGPPFVSYPGEKPFFPNSTHGTLLRGRFTAAPSPNQLAWFLPGSDLAGNPLSQLWLISGNSGNATISAPVLLAAAAMVVAADFDSDGFDDVITASGPMIDALGNPYGEPSIHFQRNRGDGTFDTPQRLASPTGFTSELVVADVNLDGKPDLIAASLRTGNVDVFLQQGVEPIPDFSTWIARFDLADPSPHADPDGDGIVNLLEYASGTSPGPLRPSSLETPPAPAAPQILITRGERGSASHPRPRRPDGSPLDIRLEWSADLDEWQSVPGVPTISSDNGSAEWETLRWSFEGCWDKTRFHRLRVTSSETP